MKSPWSWVPSLYFAEGLPYVAVVSISVVLYKQLGLSNADITFYTSWLYLPWLIKFLWSPFIDIAKTKRWWVTSMELLIGAAFAGIALTIPTSHWLQWSLCIFWLMTFSSATHDIAADGFYMLGLTQHDQAVFVGIRSTFYRLANIMGQGILVMLAGNLQVVFRSSKNTIPLSWSLIFYGLAGLFIALWLWHSYILPHPSEDEPDTSVQSIEGADEEVQNVSASRILDNLCNTIATFIMKDIGWKQVAIGILFMLLYRMPEGLLAKVSTLFLIDPAHNGGLGLSPQELGLVQGTVGVIGLTLGGIIGGICVGKHGLKSWLWPMVCAITLPDAVYVYLAYCLPHSLLIINVCIFIEQFGYGFGFTAYMLYLIYFSQGKYKTSHYAICTALMAASMMIPGMFSGEIQEIVGYKTFFLIVMACCSITFLVTAFIKIDPEFGKKKTPIAEKKAEEVQKQD